MTDYCILLRHKLTHVMYHNLRWFAGIIVWTGILLCLILLVASKLKAYTWYFSHRQCNLYHLGGRYMYIYFHSPHSCWLFILPVLVFPGHDCPLQPVWPQLHYSLRVYQCDRPAETLFPHLCSDLSDPGVYWWTASLVSISGVDVACYWYNHCD